MKPNHQVFPLRKRLLAATENAYFLAILAYKDVIFAKNPQFLHKRATFGIRGLR